jgi:hypothetical protein
LADYSLPSANLIATAEHDVNATTPIPAALPLLATGLGALVLLGWRRGRNH